MEEREKVVRHMWDVYTQSKGSRLPKFWQEAFEAAYEHLVSDVPGVRDAAVTEIAKMSVLSVSLDPLPGHSKVSNLSSSSSSVVLHTIPSSVVKQNRVPRVISLEHNFRLLKPLACISVPSLLVSAMSEELKFRLLQWLAIKVLPKIRILQD